ncbi:MAG: hypothetical protein GYB53_22645 [Rhodobacteraceae bacterium]|jgi:hypothetical protein|uniref:Plasmid segregation centromere-binding protein ParG n=2 Tax=Rhodobacterales TaxID=204455 RepID=A0A2T5ZX95_9RHOB|nr:MULTISPECIES: hypothetical protein [Rhodobacterales]MBR9766233.1 hypothetical protein [Paracoccaceae bacterium]AJE47466.1 hypothetical protein P73_2751 [Celeribacter indicus]KRW94131.1 hypothetical protein AQY21_21210 [Paracoccus sp. MKU1]MBR9824063.1 hypothetical protein [Paracoccaceae bacterium]PTX36200.1 plasmid segregation centromere-binding protein ParG [Allosediminivita pacifica]|tara:strand:+ start:492 stop:746 length:255 start_codon:yes stop_codon:yes gene_type:complete
MTGRNDKRGFAARPVDAETWIKAGEAPSAHGRAAAIYTARLTIDITPDLRGRIKVAAFSRGVTVADMLRELLGREYPEPEGEPQ